MTKAQKKTLDFIRESKEEFGVVVGNGKRKLLGFPKGTRVATFDSLSRNKLIVISGMRRRPLGKGIEEIIYLCKVV